MWKVTPVIASSRTSVVIQHEGFTAEIRRVCTSERLVPRPTVRYQWEILEVLATGEEDTPELAIRAAWAALKWEVAKRNAKQAVLRIAE